MGHAFYNQVSGRRSYLPDLGASNWAAAADAEPTRIAAGSSNKRPINEPEEIPSYFAYFRQVNSLVL